MDKTNAIDLVLLVDDDELVNFLNTVIIKQSGNVNTIESVTSGSDAIHKLSHYKEMNKWPAIIFIDINMPGMNGWEFVERFQEQFSTSKGDSIICLLSSSLDPRDREKATASEWVDCYVSKPLTANVVKELYSRLQ